MGGTAEERRAAKCCLPCCPIPLLAFPLPLPQHRYNTVEDTIKMVVANKTDLVGGCEREGGGGSSGG